MKSSKLWKIRGKSSWENISKGKYFNENPIWVRYHLERTESEIPIRLAFAVSKKYGNAVKRNRFKRRIREIVRTYCVDSKLPNGLMLMVGTSKNIKGEVTFKDAEKSISAFVSSLKWMFMFNVLKSPGSKLRLFNPIWWILFIVISIYRFFSKYFPNKCRFVPSCSTYARDALANYGALKSCKLIFFFFLKCHPFHPGGFDYVELRNKPEQDL